MPAIAAASNGSYRHDPLWFRNFQYDVERERGLDFLEDLASPGEFRWDLSAGEAWLIFSTDGTLDAPQTPKDVLKLGTTLRKSEEKRRDKFASPLDRAAEAYLVERKGGKTILAGYPWFTDWGRDTFIALRGLCLATGRLADAREMLLGWAGTVSEGMLPNRFPDFGESPEYNSVDASLWFVVAVHDYFAAASQAKHRVPRDARAALNAAVAAIVEGYSRGTRYNIHATEDGLLAAGEPGVQLTWMDVKIGDWVVTPRIGKPVEIQALWLNALWIAGQTSPQWLTVFENGRNAFAQRFWNADGEFLHDVVDVDHRPGTADATFRPNQVLAVGGLPISLIDGDRARRIVDQVEWRLWTPMGLRTLERGHPQYHPRYLGGVHDRDSAYHQGTVWPWLAGPFVEAWLRVRKSGPKAIREARQRFVEPLLAHLETAGLGHLSEIADAEAPHTPRGCPFQAWSLGELLRVRKYLLSDD
jgi:predicted glycogen debranching enzyme